MRITFHVLLLAFILICSNPLFADELFQINSGITGTWYNPNTSGQGMLIEVLPNQKLIFLAWFTYADESTDQQNEWWTALGSYQDNKSSLLITETNGGFFNQTSDIENTAIGQMVLSFIDCDHASVDFNFIQSNKSGHIQLQRLVPDQLCESLSDE